jgi:hypothetical protein
MRGPPQRTGAGNGAAAAALFCACMYLCWSRTRMFVRAYAAHTAAWEHTQWWWRQCADMQFYERLQEHMDICDRLQVVPHAALKWHAAGDVARVVDAAEVAGAALLLAAVVAWNAWHLRRCRRRRAPPMF